MWKGALVLAMGACALSGAAVAQEAFPTRPMSLIVSNSVGTAPEVLARLYAERMGRILGQQMVVVPRPGGGGIIGAQAVASAAPDGHTLLLANSGQGILASMKKDLAFDPIKSFAGVSMVADAPATLVISPSLGVRTLKDFVALAKAKPGSINYATAGFGSTSHLAGEYFARQAQIDLFHVPYTDLNSLLPDMLTGRTHAVFASIPFTLGQVREGKLYAIAAGSHDAMRTPIEIPSAREAGIDFEYSTWYGILAPARTPPAVLQALAKAADEASRDPTLTATVQGQGVNTRIIALKDFDAYIQQEMNRLAPILKAVGEKMQN